MDLTLLEELKGKLNLGEMSKSALIGIAVIFVMVAGAAGRLFLSGTATATEFEVSTSEAESQSAEEPESSEGSVFVHVSGAVASPGLVELEEGSRVDDAVRAAGGFSQDAAPDALNLARVCQDGEQLKVPSLTEAQEAQKSENTQPATAYPTSSDTAQASDGGLVNVNTADANQLATLPGIGSATAQKIISDRASKGPFKSKEDLKRVSGIGDKKYESIKDLICV